jgi:hypothetical protein
MRLRASSTRDGRERDCAALRRAHAVRVATRGHGSRAFTARHAHSASKTRVNTLSAHPTISDAVEA